MSCIIIRFNQYFVMRNITVNLKHEKLIMSHIGRSIMWNIQYCIYDHSLHKFLSACLFVEWDLICAASSILFSFNGFCCDHNSLLTKGLVWSSRAHTGKYFQLALPIKLIVFRRGEVLWELPCRNALALICADNVGDSGQFHYSYEFLVHIKLRQCAYSSTHILSVNPVYFSRKWKEWNCVEKINGKLLFQYIYENMHFIPFVFFVTIPVQEMDNYLSKKRHVYNTNFS